MSAAILRGKTIAFSGTFNNLKRDQVVKAATAAGATVNSSVSKKIDLLITGDSNVGVKKVEAKHLGIKVLPSKSFHQFVKSGGAARVQKAAAPVKVVRPAAPARRVQAYEEDFEAEEEETSGVMPWEMEADAAPARQPRRAAPMKADRAPATSVRRTVYPRKVISYPVRPFTAPVIKTVGGATKASSAAPKVRREAPALRRSTAKKAPFFQLDGLNVGFAGTFLQLKKIQAAAMAEKNGANVVVTSGPQVDILVCGKGAEAKRMMAKKKGILPIAESTFIAACRK